MHKISGLLSVQGLCYDYDGLDFHSPLLNKVDFELPEGGLLHLRGDNGSGKTTLLKLLAGVLKPASGQIHYAGHSLHDPLYSNPICYVGHKSGLSMALTVMENCLYDLLYPFDGDNPLTPKVDLDQVLQSFDLFALRHTPCGLLSQGQKRRVALMRLVYSNKALWLLDEPLVALDKSGVALLMDLIKCHFQGKGQVVLTSHQDLPQAFEICQEYRL